VRRRGPMTKSQPVRGWGSGVCVAGRDAASKGGGRRVDAFVDSQRGPSPARTSGWHSRPAPGGSRRVVADRLQKLLVSSRAAAAAVCEGTEIKRGAFVVWFACAGTGRCVGSVSERGLGAAEKES